MRQLARINAGTLTSFGAGTVMVFVGAPTLKRRTPSLVAPTESTSAAIAGRGGHRSSTGSLSFRPPRMSSATSLDIPMNSPITLSCITGGGIGGAGRIHRAGVDGPGADGTCIALTVTAPGIRTSSRA